MKLRFESRVHDDTTYTVWAIDREPESVAAPHAWHVADVFFNGGEWLLVKYDLDGELVHGEIKWIDADHAQWSDLREFTNHVNEARHSRTEPEQAALNELLSIRRLEFREDTREDARLMGIALARVWARTLFSV